MAHLCQEGHLLGSTNWDVILRQYSSLGVHYSQPQCQASTIPFMKCYEAWHLAYAGLLRLLGIFFITSLPLGQNTLFLSEIFADNETH